jgi:hypothetical protein
VSGQSSDSDTTLSDLSNDLIDLLLNLLRKSTKIRYIQSLLSVHYHLCVYRLFMIHCVQLGLNELANASECFSIMRTSNVSEQLLD